VEVEYDLSQTLFICTANSTHNISAPLLDRMEVINLPGYTELEKIHIAQAHLIKKQRDDHGLAETDIRVTKEALIEIIQKYTREAGVRALEREIGKIFRKVVTQLAKEDRARHIAIGPKQVPKYLGLAKYHRMIAEHEDEVGVTIGLGVTHSGGELLITEVETMPGSGRRILTGQLGDVMKESAQIAISYIRTHADRLGVLSSKLRKLDLHIHLPEGAQPKDGPSAGITLVTSIVSALTEIPVRRDLAMTGEITLRGQVLQIGGVKEKLLAAKRGDITEVLIPKENVKDLSEVPDEIKHGLKITPVESLDEVIAISLVRPPKALTPAEISADEQRIRDIKEDVPTPTAGDDSVSRA
jgi:ATP-dependent Lon protease